MADASSNGTATEAVSVNGTASRFRRPRRTNIRLLQTGVAKTTAGKPYSIAAGTILPPPDYDLGWRQQALDTDTLGKETPARLLELLASLSPEMSKGLWDYQRLLNPGWKCEAFNMGKDSPSPRGQAVVDEILDRLKRKHGSVDVVLGRLHMGAYLRGGYFGEAVLDEAGREVVDIATPDPASVRFKVVEDQQGQKVYQMGQWQDNKFIPLDEEETVAYIPIDSFPGNPYGRPLVAPAMFASLFLIGLLHDLRRVISQQGWPRIDIAINTQKLLEGLEKEGALTQEEVENKIAAAIKDVQYGYGVLQPDDAYIHGDEVELKGPIGVTAGTNLSGIESVIEVVERMLVRALKTMPLMLGITDGVSEANANRQWEILVAGVKALQHLSESMLERFMELACQLKGVQADVKWTFSEIRAAEAQRDALARSQEIDNAFKLLDKGMTDRDETAEELVGHPPAKSEEDMLAAQQAAFGTEDGEEDEPEEDVQDTDEDVEKGGNNATAVSVERWLRRQRDAVFVPADRSLWPEKWRSMDAYIADMQREGLVYAGSRKIAYKRSTARHEAAGEKWIPSGTWRVNGQTVAEEYEVLVAFAEQH